MGIPQQQNISSESLKGATGIALLSGGDAYWFLVTGSPARSAAMSVLFLLSGPKIGFSRGDTLPRQM